MFVGVGSTNPVKRSATKAAIGEMPGLSVDAVDVDSGVPEQPRGHAQTVEGAISRARRAYDAGEFDLGVGIEGGIAEFDGVDGRFLVMWAAVTDGDRVETASGPALRLPDAVAERVDAGEELGPVMDDAYGRESVATQEGAAGILTGNVVSRTDALETAVAGALGPFVTDAY
ncbi:inosine/xanthosine triphosphatase [Halorubellus sp. JP-L1]|uniref:inosine/xanthosine triphosphatase n=1 Tax=Halorubellus sp. JP-L1 TaxID=2715753 RepID=UPI0014081F68|nr:inosine/xanthosine triphosphatase [Halorubellus sp. JP-L1]NHN42425.1 inosine/xanthosine triphosphatase [Halorubellus sp. JP-L1]